MAVDPELRRYLNGIFVLLSIAVGAIIGRAAPQDPLAVGAVSAVVIGCVTYAVFVSPAYTLGGALDNLFALRDLILQR